MNTQAPHLSAGQPVHGPHAGRCSSSLRGSQGALRSCQLSAPNNRGQEPQ